MAIVARVTAEAWWSPCGVGRLCGASSAGAEWASWVWWWSSWSMGVSMMPSRPRRDVASVGGHLPRARWNGLHADVHVTRRGSDRCPNAPPLASLSRCGVPVPQRRPGMRCPWGNAYRGFVWTRRRPRLSLPNHVLHSKDQRAWADWRCTVAADDRDESPDGLREPAPILRVLPSERLGRCTRLPRAGGRGPNRISARVPTIRSINSPRMPWPDWTRGCAGRGRRRPDGRPRASLAPFPRDLRLRGDRPRDEWETRWQGATPSARGAGDGLQSGIDR
jgi:hypothetical protein